RRGAMRPGWLVRAALAAAFSTGFAGTAPAQEDGPPLVFAAASLTDALAAVGDAWAAAGHAAPVFSFASSSLLARQIASGAPAAIFASADQAWMDELAAQELIVPESRVDLLGNALVLVAPADAGVVPVEVGPDLDLASML